MKHKQRVSNLQKPIYIRLDEGKYEEIKNILENGQGAPIKTFKDPLEIEIYNMAEKNAKRILEQNTKGMKEEEKIRYLEDISKQYFIEKSLNS